MEIRLVAPEYLWLLLTVPAVWLLPRPATDRAHALLRSLVLALVVLALARPVAFRSAGEEHHAFVLDRSASVGPAARALAEERLAELLQVLPGDARARLVSFGDAGPWEAPDRLDEAVHLAEGGSPLAAALAAAARGIPDGARGAVTVISDGRATDPRWGAAAVDLQRRGLPVHTVRLPAPAGDCFPVSLEPRGTLRVGHAARLAVRLLSLIHI